MCIRYETNQNNIRKVVSHQSSDGQSNDGYDSYVQVDDSIVLQSEFSDITGNNVCLCTVPQRLLYHMPVVLQATTNPLLSTARASVVAATPSKNCNNKNDILWRITSCGFQPNDSSYEVADVLVQHWNRGIQSDGRLTNASPIEMREQKSGNACDNERAFLSKYLRENRSEHVEYVKKRSGDYLNRGPNAMFEAEFRTNLLPQQLHNEVSQQDSPNTETETGYLMIHSSAYEVCIS